MGSLLPSFPKVYKRNKKKINMHVFSIYYNLLSTYSPFISRNDYHIDVLFLHTCGIDVLFLEMITTLTYSQQKNVE